MSRLRNPMSKSTTHVLCPLAARPNAKLAALVVLPTPPFPEVMQIILPLDGEGESIVDGWVRTKSWLLDRRDGEDDEKHLLF